MHKLTNQRPATGLSRAEIMTALRAQTRTQHDELEKALDLLAPPLSRDRFLRLVQRFFGFHRVWEPTIAQHGFLREFHLARHRLPLLRGDLLALGMDATDIESLPLCYAARSCGMDEDEALGALYVMEGSTLGGQIISRALATQDWVPHGGLRSFNPYGAGTGAMWRGFGDLIEREGANRDAAKIVTGAQRTFDLLTQWLPA
jgi:heme oxygenase